MKKLLCCCLAFLLPAVAMPAETVTIPFGTTVFCELDQQVTTRQKEAYAVQTGDIVQAHVWKDVWVDGHRVITAGTPVYAKVERMKKARMAGQKGFLEIEVEVEPGLGVSIPYKEIDLEKKIRELPLILQVPEGSLSRASVVSVNGNEISPIQVTVLGEAGEEGYKAVVDFKLLSNHFGRGMNRFAVEMGEYRAEVLLEIEF